MPNKRSNPPSVADAEAAARATLKAVEQSAREKVGLVPTTEPAYFQMQKHPGEVSLGTLETGELLFVPPKARAMHTHIVGGTGKGKSTLLQHMIRQDIRNGSGVVIVDPHGGYEDSLYNSTLCWLEESGYSEDRTIHLIDPSSDEFTTGFNPLKRPEGVDLSVIADATLEAFERAWGDEDTQEKPRLRRVLTATFSLLAANDLTLADAHLLFDFKTGGAFREHLLEGTDDHYTREVWQDLNNMKPSDFREHVEGPLNRLAEFTRSDSIRHTVGQTENIIDFKEAMDGGHVVLANLQGGNTASRKATKLLGALIVRGVFEQCLRRKWPYLPCYLYIDECHQYLSGDIPEILDQARKFGLHAVLTHQRLGQLEEAGADIYNAVRGSTEVKIVMGGMTMEEAKILAEDIIPLELEKPVAALISPQVVGFKTIELLNRSATANESMTNTEGTAIAETDSFASSSGSGSAESSGSSDGSSTGSILQPNADDPAMSEIASEVHFSGSAHSTFESSTHGFSTTRTESSSRAHTTGSSQTFGRAEAREAILEERITAVHGLDKLLYEAAAGLRKLDTGEAVVAIGMQAFGIQTTFVKPRVPTRPLAEFKRELFEGSSAALPIHRATLNLEARRNAVWTAIGERKKALADERVKREEDFVVWE